MKIAFIGQKGMPASWGGVEKHVEELATRLAKNGHEVTVYSRQWYCDSDKVACKTLPKVVRLAEALSNHKNYQPQINLDGVILRFTPTIHTKNLDTIIHTFTATLDALGRDFDIIHYHGVGPALLSWIPRIFKPSAKVIVTFHCSDRLHGKWGLLAKLMLRLGEWAACKFPHETIVVSRTLQKYVKEKYNCEATYIPNGAAETLDTSSSEVLSHFGLMKGEYLIAVSRLIAHKGIHYLIEAFRQLKNENLESVKNLKLVIVGSGVHTEDYVSFLHAAALDNPDVIFTGWQIGKDLAALISEAKLFIHPSNSEGLPLSVLEAMSYGKSVIASAIPEHQELITDKRFLFSPGEVKDLKRVIIWALQNPEVCAVNSLQNKIRVEREYNWEDIVGKVENMYKVILISKREGLPLFSVKSIK